MRPASSQNLLSALAGTRRVTIGLESPDALRRLSDLRALTCPGCNAPVILHAGTVRAHHFAHLPGAVCSLPQTEPETEEHRAGKLLLARWLRERLPDSEVIVEAFVPETGQRADVLAQLQAEGGKPRRIALEYQCANLTAREWRRRHTLYREAGMEDLWLLGGSRLIEDKRERSILTTELERAMLWDGAPLLFLDALGTHFAAETLARFRPEEEAQAARPVGRLAGKNLLGLDFPFHLLDWPRNRPQEAPVPAPTAASRSADSAPLRTDAWIREWLTHRYRVTSETLAAFFGLPVSRQETFACDPQLWQAAIYYRFIHQRVGASWRLAEVETWARAYLPLAQPVNLRKLKGALSHYQELLAAAGMLSLPMGYGRVNARIQADLNTLPSPPDREETLRLARYRRTLARENQTPYEASPEA